MSRNPVLLITSVAILVIGSAMVICASEIPLVSNIPPEQLGWEVTEESVAFAPLVGNRFEEPYMAMVRLPAGLSSPAHIKTANMFGVVVAGTMVHNAAGEDFSEEILLPKGSFYKIPANLLHVSKCVSDVECVTFLYQDGKFDFLPKVQ